RQQAMGLYFEPMLLATMARCTLALGRPDQALAAAEEALDIMDGRGLTTCALLAPITLAEVLMASRGAAAAERVEAVLAHAAQTARHCHARIFEPQITSPMRRSGAPTRRWHRRWRRCDLNHDPASPLPDGQRGRGPRTSRTVSGNRGRGRSSRRLL